MKQVITAAFITLTLLSCTKEKQESIVGVWKEAAIYTQDNSGNYKWSDIAHGFPYILTLSSDGTYSFWQCTTTDRGAYQYDHANKQIRLESIAAANAQTISVSLLEDDYLILDYGLTSMGEYKVKLIRSQY